VEERLLSEGAAWIAHDILLPETDFRMLTADGRFAVKTGTSYGYRDAWALGVDRGYTVGVWIGRPDGTPVPGHYGAQTATPLLKSAFQLLPRHEARIDRPDTVTGARICWPGGQRAVCDADGECDCRHPRNAWVLDETAPGTLTPTRDDPGPAAVRLAILLAEDKTCRIPSGCDAGMAGVPARIILWPKTLESWLPAAMQRQHLIPPVCSQCGGMDVVIEEAVMIEGLGDGEVILKRDDAGDYPVFTLRAQGGNGPWYWFENSVLMGEGKTFRFAPGHPGDYQLLVIDQSGALDKIGVKVF
jgi:penicillin-binding protein 1C